MHYLRQHSHSITTLLMTALLAVWLGYSCQDCFAADRNEAASNMHAMMDCCPQSAHADQASADSDGCQNNASLELTALSVDHTQAKVEKLALVLINEFFIDSWHFKDPQPVSYSPPDLPPFSDRSFNSYRILLI